MKALVRITDRALGHLGLFLIGALSWAAERLGPRRPEPEAPRRVVRLPGARPSGAGRAGVTRVTTPRVAA
jgi:hypothetical protein